MPKGGNGGGGGGKPSGGENGATWRGSRGDDTIYIVDDGQASEPNQFTVTDFLATSFDGRRGSDTLDFSRLTSDGISISFDTRSAGVSFDQGYLGFVLDYRLPSSNFTPATFVDFENIVGTSGNDSLSGFVGSVAEIYGGAGDDRLGVRGPEGSVVVGGQGSDDFVANGMIYVGGDWDGTYSVQAGDGTTDFFFGNSVILDFELPDSNFAGDRLVVAGSINSSDADALETFLSLQFFDGVWVDPNGVEHGAAILQTKDGTGTYFTLVGVSAADANALILPQISAHISTSEAGFLLSGTKNDDWLELVDNANQVLFKQDGGSDTLLYGDFADPSDDTLFFEGAVPTEWTHSVVNGIDTYSAQYNGHTITIVGLDETGFNSLTMEAVPVGTTSASLDPSAELASAMLATDDAAIMSSLLAESSELSVGALSGAAGVTDLELVQEIMDDVRSTSALDDLLDSLVGGGANGQESPVAGEAMHVASEALIELLDDTVTGGGMAFAATSPELQEIDASVAASSAGS